LINRPRRGELISHAGRVNTAIHQVQEENNNRAEAVREKPLTAWYAESPERQEREERHFREEMCGDGGRHAGYTLGMGSDESGMRDRGQGRRIDAER